ncbi:hypothetical protein FSP39_014572 [Pinctada imbricata]|uniref:Steroid 17-alpha-hydroxylase/17,20 lyase n=1 Tax=Pinctada imbricata TaxID=66713 RepID=A0AA88YIL1_PINIB|nr:hypothetical protein FSP39_014572 [Pinctada imbricata]
MGIFEYALGFLNLQTVLIATFFGLLTYHVYQRFKYRRPPGPWALPLIGNWTIYTKPMMHREIAKMSETYGPVCSIALGPFRAVFLNSLDVVIEAMVKRKADFANRPMLNSFAVFSQGFKNIAFSSYTAVWKLQKKVAGKALRSYMQGTHLETMLNDVLDKVSERIAQEEKPFVAADYMNKIVIHMLFNMCFGRKCNLDDPEVNRLLVMEDETIELFGNGFFEDIIPFMTKIYTTKRWNKMSALMDEIYTFFNKELKEHKDTFDRSNIRDFTDNILLAHSEALEEEKTEDLKAFTDDHMVQSISDVFFAGLDTTRLTLDWFISSMVAYPEIQVKCQEEIDKVIGFNRRPSTSDRANLCFTEACIMETMRTGAVAGLGIPHETLCDTTVGGYDVPKGTMVFINHWALHNDKNFWKYVDKFDPYRYLDKDGKLDSKPANWLPFSAGRRVCLGETVAKAELVFIVSCLLQNFTFMAPPCVNHKIKSRSGFTGSEHPAYYKVIVKKRK